MTSNFSENSQKSLKNLDLNNSIKTNQKADAVDNPAATRENEQEIVDKLVGNNKNQIEDDDNKIQYDVYNTVQDVKK